MGPLDLVVDHNVEVARIPRVGRHGDLAGNLVALCAMRQRAVGIETRRTVHRERFAGVEDGLLPVGVLGVRAGREADGLVAGRERDVEPGEERVDVCARSARRPLADDAQSLRVTPRRKGAVKARSAFLTLSRSNVMTSQGLVATALRSTVSTSGSRIAISFMQE